MTRYSLLGTIVFTALMLGSFGQPAQADSLEELGEDAWTWRALTQPSSGDDVPRIARPAGWLPDWSAQAVAARHTQLNEFELRWQALANTADSPESVTDYRLIGSLLARVRWELDHIAAWQRQPHFYITQALTPIFETLLPPPPLDAARIAQLQALLQHIPATLAAAQENLSDSRGPFVDVALTQLEQVPASLLGMHEGLVSYLPATQHSAMKEHVDKALESFADYAAFLRANRNSLNQTINVGRDSYQFFLSEVALYPYTPEQLTIMGAQEWERSATFEAIEANRNRDVENLPLAANVDVVIAQLSIDELAVRDFLADEQLLTIPDSLRHYQGLAFPEYLSPIGWLGRTLDLTNQHRLDSNATIYLPKPSPDLGFFNLSIARDPRPILVHEGVPGHYSQLALSWMHTNPLRRHYYDSGANEGTGFYAEEMMLQAGYFDNSPKTREVIYTFARFRALRVEVDVKLALGEFTIDQAADYLEQKMNLDRGTAVEEAIFFAATPGQAISYQIGKLQTLAFLSAARSQLSERFSLQHFHDYLWRNGNVPIALQQREYLELNK
ncbi:MAG: DUF885 domain-containing protein [SAR86 cluster bacterium]|uniref:DUF885 domain-containing protein n=1 Tax=SAR86 cluster bacterium TaxID=2030880 RepID=A0A2A5AP35_9GAMM|nr:MAG: DUF885 domain-containing protein [SAR86 cluster bacterium]